MIGLCQSNQNNAQPRGHTHGFAVFAFGYSLMASKPDQKKQEKRAAEKLAAQRARMQKARNARKVTITNETPVNDHWVHKLTVDRSGMVKKKKKAPPESPMVKGKKLNPKPMTEEQRLKISLKNLTVQELKDMASMLLRGNYDDLKILAEDPSTSTLQVMLASTCVKIIAKGDMHALNLMLDRLIGKVKQKIEIESDAPPPQIIVNMPANGREAKQDKAS